MRILQASIVLCPAPGDLLDPRIESRSLALQADSLPSEPLGTLNKRNFIKLESKEGGKDGGQIRKWEAMPRVSCPTLFCSEDSMLMCNFLSGKIYIT